MVFSLREVVFGEPELLEHRVIRAGLHYVLGIADHCSQIGSFYLLAAFSITSAAHVFRLFPCDSAAIAARA